LARIRPSNDCSAADRASDALLQSRRQRKPPRTCSLAAALAGARPLAESAARAIIDGLILANEVLDACRDAVSLPPDRVEELGVVIDGARFAWEARPASPA